MARVHGEESGLIGLALEVRRSRTDHTVISSSARSLAGLGDRENPDIVVLPGSSPPATATAMSSATTTPTTAQATATPTPGDCCTVGTAAGCRDTSCSDCVCDVDSFCCDGLWDPSCVEVAGTTCNATCRCRAAVCVGDCDASGDVSINELILAVRIALEQEEVSACSSVDANTSGSVEVNELVAAVGRALAGCGPPA